jgi:hypothetical protein
MTTIYKATIRRDAQTITPVQVPMHEIAVLKEIFGEENVTVGEQAGELEEATSESEYARLSSKYGEETTKNVYGAKASGNFAQAFERSRAGAKEERRAQGKDAGRDAGRAPAGEKA